MKTRLGLVAMALSVALGGAITFAPARSATAAEEASDLVKGEVTKIDSERGRVTIRSSDGSVYEFEASPETLEDLKLGDRIEARRRPTTK